MSNWVRYITSARNIDEMNVELIQARESEQLFYKSCRLIKQHERLMFGYCKEYAERFGLPYFEQNQEMHQIGNTNHGRSMSGGHLSRRPPLMRMAAIKETDMHGMEDHEEKHRLFIKSEPQSSFESEETSNDKENAIFCCRPCQKVFADEERLEKHNMTIHAEDESLEELLMSSEKTEQCPRCRKRFELKSSLEEHLKLHDSLDHKNLSIEDRVAIKLLTCPLCDMKLRRLIFAEHIRSHCQNGVYTCPHCDKKFKKYYLIRKHIRNFHPEIEHPCDQCEKSFKTSTKLKLHQIRHSDKREFLCSECGKMLKRKDKLNEHIRRFHTGDKSMTIEPIDVPVVKEKKVKKRLVKKTVIRMDSDEVESSPKVDKIEKKRKTMTKSPPNDYERFIYKCHECRLGFKRRGMLVNHLYKRHPEVPIDSVPELNLPILKEQKCYYCQFCDKVYKSSSKRKAHIMKYHPDAIDMNELRTYRNPAFSETVGSITTEPQACPWCYKQYASKTKLIQHQRIKHPEHMKGSWSSQSSTESPTKHLGEFFLRT